MPQHDVPSTAPRIVVTADGPYRVEGAVEVRDAHGDPRPTGGICHLCRCGGSRNPPFCDATHGLKGFDGTETAERGDATDRTHGPDDEAVISATIDGPFRVRGSVPVVGADGRPYPVRPRQSLCRCGRSQDKPFCDGTHATVGFRDPLPADQAAPVPTLYAWIGGLKAIQRLTERFYADILGEPDPVLGPVFAGMDAAHPGHVAAWLAETFGGPAAYTHEHGGYEHMVAQHRGRGLTEPQRQRWVARLVATADLVGVPDDPDFRAAFVAYLEWGSRIALYNSQPDAAVIAHAPVPRWGWGESAPWVPQAWE